MYIFQIDMVEDQLCVAPVWSALSINKVTMHISLAVRALDFNSKCLKPNQN